MPVGVSIESRRQVLDAVRTLGQAGRAQLPQLTGLSQAQISRAVRALLDDGLLTEGDALPTANGRPQIPLQLVAGSRHVLAVVLDGRDIAIAIADLHGTIVYEDSRPARQRRLDLSNAAHTVAAMSEVPKARLVAAAIAAPGIVRGAEVTAAPVLGWGSEPADVGGEFSRALGLPCAVGNDVDLALLGERFAGAARGVDHAALLHVVGAVGAAILHGGQLLHGGSGAAGEVGFLPLGRDMPRDGYGPFERRYSATALASEAGLGESPDPVGEICRRVNDGDRRARRVLTAALRGWSDALVSLGCILDPDLLLLGGDAAAIDDAALDQLRGLLTDRLPRPATLTRAALGSHAVTVGAIAAALDTASARAYSL